MRARIVLPWILAASVSLGCAHRDRHYDGGAPPPQGHTAGHARGHGPPPHAPAHGYRHKHGGRYLEYDSGHDVYLVIGLPDLFWYDGWYHRRIGDRWQRSDHEAGPWYDSAWDDIPPGLRGDRGKSGKGHGKGQGKAKGKND